MPPPALTTSLVQLAVLLACAVPLTASGAQWSGLLDVRAQAAASERSWTRAGMGKTRDDGSGIGLGQAILAAEVDLSDAISGSVVLNAADRPRLVDLHEAWLGWNRLPSGPWKIRARAGLFFPPGNQEIDYQRLTWTPSRTISSSAINSWIGEELRTKGLEFSLTHRGRESGSPHEFGATAAVLNGNDPAGTLLAWRGWSVGDRISGASEAIDLADLPVYRADGAINKQDRAIRLFREIDGRAGYYVALHYGYADTLDLLAMHYDNRGDPLVVKQGQYSWATRFHQFGVRLRPAAGWELLAQYLAGATAMGTRAAALDYRAWYALASRRIGNGSLTVRYDRFGTREDDILPADPNGEDGRAIALAYAFEFSPAVSLVTELLTVHSNRPARRLVGEAARQNDRSVTTSLRWQF